MAQTAVGGTFWRFPGWPNPAWVYDNAPYLCATPYKLGEMMAPNVPPIEMRSPGSRSGRGLGFISLTPTGQPTNGSSPMPSFYGSTAPTPVTGSTPTLSPVASPPIGTPAGVTYPVFYDVNGNHISQATCGDVYGMTVPGYEGQTLHIMQSKNGAPQFNGAMVMPMPNYASVCNQDEGTYVVQAFTQAGQFLGSTTFIVNPKIATGTGLPTLPAATGASLPAAAPGTTSSTSALPATTATTPITTGTSMLSAGLSNLSSTDWMLLAGLGLLMFLAGTGSGGKGR